MPIPNSISDHYGLVPEDYWSEEYFKLDNQYFQNEINWLRKLIVISEGMKSLDIGAGIGKQMLALQRLGFDTYGFEPSEQFRTRAIEKMGLDPVKLKLGSIEEMSYDSDTFDFISFGAVLEHLYNPSESILKALKWLKKGGIIHIEVPNSAWLTHKLLNAYYRMKGLDYVANLSPMHTPYHLYEFSIESFRKHASIHHYEVADYGYYVCESYLPGIMDSLVRPIMRKTNTGMQLSVWLRK